MSKEATNDLPAFWAEPPRRPCWSPWHIPELAAAFLTGLIVLSFTYSGTGGVNGDYLTVPGFDSFYHLKMAELLPEIGLVKTFPWLTTTIFEQRFVSHHYGFHALLWPFIKASELFGDADPLQAGRWALATCFGLVVMLFHALLIAERVPYRLLWLLMFLVMPIQFFGRHAFIRAICPSLVFMLLLTLTMFRRRYLLSGLVIIAYIQLYLGAVVYAPLLVAAYFAAGLLGKPGKRVSWKLPAWTASGWLVGLLIHPYGRLEAINFLRVQIFGSGLTPDLPVGREWKSYDPAWFFAQMSGATLILLAVAIFARLRLGNRVNARTAGLLLVNFAFLGLTLKARRFIEYWPIFSVLSSAYLLAPLLRDRRRPAPGAASDEDARDIDADDAWLDTASWTPRGTDAKAELTAPLVARPATAQGSEWLAAASLALALFGAVLLRPAMTVLHTEPFFAEWRMWMLLLAALALVPAAHWSVSYYGTKSPLAAVGGTIAAAGTFWLLVLAIGAFACARRDIPTARMATPIWAWAAIAAAYIIVPLVAWFFGHRQRTEYNRASVSQLVTGVATGLLLTVSAILFCAGPLVSLRNSNRSGFDLAAIRGAMDYLKEHSAEGDIVFTDDWDVFPVFFFYNHHNRYVAGLDPKFTHERDPVLWERYVKITRAQTPADVTVERLGPDGRPEQVDAHVTLDDIRDIFHASWVITDDDHRSLARRLDARPDLAEPVYDSPATESGRPKYRIFHIKD